MNRFIYWIKNIFDKENTRCGHFCVTCKYYDQCSEEISLLYISKNSKNTRIKKEHDELRKVS